MLEKWAGNITCEGCRLMETCDDDTAEIINSPVDNCNFLFYLPQLSDQTIGGILLAISLLILCGSLMVMVKVLNSVLQGSYLDRNVSLGRSRNLDFRRHGPIGEEVSQSPV